MNLPQGLKTQKMPPFHIGRLLCNEAKRNYLELEEEGLQVPLPSAGESFGCRKNPSQGLKTRKMPLLHIGRLPSNEAKRESPWTEEEGLQVPLPSAGEPFSCSMNPSQ